jgi:hypothetical protein
LIYLFRTSYLIHQVKKALYARNTKVGALGPGGELERR